MGKSVPAYFTDVNYSDASVITEEMKLAIAATRDLPRSRGVKIIKAAHCTAIDYGKPDLPMVGYRIEVLGHLSVLAELAARTINDGRTFFQEVGFASVMASAQDILAHGFRPDTIEDAISLNQYRWGRDNPQRLMDLRLGFQKAATRLGAAFTGGETAAVKYLVNPPDSLDIGDAPVIHTITHGTATHSQFVSGDDLRAGDVMLGALSTGPHINAISAIIRLPGMPGILQDRLSDGTLFGEAVMAEMGCYYDLVLALQDNGVEIHAMLPGSGGGVSKLAYDKPCHIRQWPDPLPVFEKIMEYVAPYDFLKEFNAGIGWIVFVPKAEALRAIETSRSTSTPLMEIGEVGEGKRGVLFQPETGWWLGKIGPEGLWLDSQEK